jgi:hypothetical protein
MNHRLEKNNTNLRLVIILSDSKELVYYIYHNDCLLVITELPDKYVVVRKDRQVLYDEKAYFVFIHKNYYDLKIIEYLVSNNICTIYKTYDNGTNLVLNPHILLELI